jgi:hypothetical protein
MITDAIVGWVLSAVSAAINLLPDGQPVSGMPGVGPLLLWLGRVDSLVPISGPLTFAMGVLGAGVAFVAVRLILTAWNLVWP